jgi:DNA repair protein RadC
MQYEATKLAIRQWSEDDRPREKLLLKGRGALSDAELIAILIGSGNRKESAVTLSMRILNSVGNDLNALSRLSSKELEKFHGIGEAKAISIIAALELGRRRKETEFTDHDKITSSKDIFNLLAPHFSDLPHEEFWVIYLNKSHKLISKQCISKGGIGGTVADPKIIFKQAIEYLASSIVLAHNHPSGNLKPSRVDIDLTKKMKDAGVLMEINVVDHVIFTDKGYYSFADEAAL